MYTRYLLQTNTETNLDWEEKKNFLLKENI